MDVKLPPVYGKIVLSLDNCLLPAEKLSRSPSIADGLNPQTEYDLRITGCELIQTAGILLKLPQVAMATGQVLFQRFYFCKSFVRHPMEITAMGCVCLASKIEEAPRRIRDVINVFHHMRQVRFQKSITPLILDSQYVALKTQVIKAERRVLKELGFCVHVKHPHKLIVCYLEVLSLRSNRSVVQMAWNYMNDSLRTEVFLRYTPETVACACIYLAARKLKIVLPKTPSQWFTLLDVREEDIQDVCRRILNLYKRPKADQEVLEDVVEKLRKNFEEEKEKRQTNVIVTENSVPDGQGTATKRKSKSRSKSYSPSPPAKSRKVAEPSPRKYSDSSPPKKSRDGDRERERSRESRSRKDENRSRRDHDSRSRKDRDHRSKKHNKIKKVDTSDYDSHSRSASFWKKFYSYG